MKQTSHLFLATVLFILFPLLGLTSLSAQSYDHKISLANISFEWSIEKQNIHIQLVAKTKGWVAIGFNPTGKMQGANFILGYVKRGKVKLQDQFGIRRLTHIRDELNNGQSHVSNAAGSEKRGKTTISFTIPLDSGDKSDKKIDPQGETKVLLAYGPARDNFTTKHKFRKALSVNLSNGVYH